MKHITTAIALVFFVLVFGLAGAPVSAHGDNVHVRGIVTQVSAQSITVQQANSTTKTLTINAKTTFERGGKPAAMSDLKVGDRVVVDVPKNSSEALEVQIGTAKAAAPKQ